MIYLINNDIFKKFKFNCLYTFNSFIHFIKKRLKVNSVLVFINLLNT